MAQSKGFFDTVLDYYNAVTSSAKEPTVKEPLKRPTTIPTPIGTGGGFTMRTEVPKELIPESVFQEILGVPHPTGVIGGRESPGLAAQRTGLRDLQAQYDLLKESAINQPQKADLTNLLNVSDALFGSNFLPGYKKPKTREERLAELAKYETLLQQSKGALTEAEIAFLKAQFYPTTGQSITANIPKASAGKGGKTVPASQVVQIADMKEQLGGVQQFMDLWKSYNQPARGLWDVIKGKASAYFPLTDENEYMAQLHQRATALGKAIEGRMTDADYERYKRNFLPLPGDSDTKAAGKIAALEAYIQNKIAQREMALSEFGYDIGTTPRVAPKPYPSAKAVAKPPKPTAPKTKPKARALTPAQKARYDQLKRKSQGLP